MEREATRVVVERMEAPRSMVNVKQRERGEGEVRGRKKKEKIKKKKSRPLFNKQQQKSTISNPDCKWVK
jgi:hypothetical protein